MEYPYISQSNIPNGKLLIFRGNIIKIFMGFMKHTATISMYRYIIGTQSLGTEYDLNT